MPPIYKDPAMLLLVATAAATAFWAVLLFLSARESPFVSYTSCLWLVALTVLQMASTRGLRRRVLRDA